MLPPTHPTEPLNKRNGGKRRLAKIPFLFFLCGISDCMHVHSEGSLSEDEFSDIGEGRLLLKCSILLLLIIVAFACQNNPEKNTLSKNIVTESEM